MGKIHLCYSIKSRINILITNKKPKLYQGADYYSSGNIKQQIKEIQKNTKIKIYL